MQCLLFAGAAHRCKFTMEFNIHIEQAQLIVHGQNFISIWLSIEKSNNSIMSAFRADNNKSSPPQLNTN